MKTDLDEAPFLRAAGNLVRGQMLRAMRPRLREPILPWLAAHVDMGFDRTAGTLGMYRPYPYQVEPLEATEDARVHRVTLMMGQRLGKSTIWRMALLKRVSDGGCSALIAYPSLDLGLKQNADAVKPLLTTLPEVRRDFALRGNVKVDSYHSPSTSSVVYFMGAGSPLLSVTAGFLVADEVDFIELAEQGEEGKNTSALKSLWLRGQTYPDRLMVVVSSPTREKGAINTEWLKGSRGVWHLRCVHCGELIPGNRLAFRLGDGDRWAGLQWRKDDAGAVVADSIRYICPHCLHEHTEDEASDLAYKGRYVHAVEDVAHRSYQAGALANPRLWAWHEIAKWQEDAIDTDGRKFLANSVLGMPYVPPRKSDASVSIEQANRARQVTYPSDLGDRLVAVCAGVDQQKSELAGRKYYVSVVRGWDDEGNSWLLSEGIDETLDALDARLTARYFGLPVTLAFIDQGGFSNADDLDPFVAAHPAAYYYRGSGAKDTGGALFVPSQSQSKLFICMALSYQCKLLDLLYSPPRPRGYAWSLPLTVGDEYFRQLCNVRPNTRMGKDGNGFEYANWAAFNGDRRDYFDAEKMALACLDVACRYLPPTHFPRGHVPIFAVRERVRAALRQKKVIRR